MVSHSSSTDFTLGIDEPAVVADRARRAVDFPALKLKVGGPTDLETVRGLAESLLPADQAGEQEG